MFLMIFAVAATVMAAEDSFPPPPRCGPEHIQVLLQTSANFGDTDDAPDGGGRYEEATRHGRDVVRLWGLIPADIQPYCQMQVEIRVQDHALRYELFRRMFRETQGANVPVSVQIADPHDQFVFDPAYAERLLDEFPCIQSLMLSEMQFAHYAKFNVESYAIPPHTRYTVDIIKMAARHGRHVFLVLQGPKWLHISADVLNRPLLDTMREYADYVIPVNEHIEARHLMRQTGVWGLWLGGYATNWGVEPQSWWFESSFMNRAGVFGDHIHPLEMPPGLYRAMILQGAAMGATVYSFEPFWDLFDFENNRCWNEVILPTLREVIEQKLVPTREQVQSKTKVAYRVAPARDINEFHRNLRDLDWLSDEGLLAKAAYGVWAPMLEFELVPNKGHWFIPLLPPDTPAPVLAQYPRVLEAGQCDSVEAWEQQLAPYYPVEPSEGVAWTCSINGHVYVMHTHENLYERQSYTLELPKPVRGVTATPSQEGLRLAWPADTGASQYYLLHADGPIDPDTPKHLKKLAESAAPEFLISAPVAGTYAITAATDTKEAKHGTVNYLDYLVLSESVSEPAEYVCVDSDGKAQVIAVPEQEDQRPEHQVVYPTFEGVPSDLQDVAEEIVARLDAFKSAYEAMDWRAVTAFYAPDYEDPNGFHREYVSRAWKWWFRRNNTAFLLRQIRNWDFSDFAATGLVRVKMFIHCTAVRRDDQPFGYDGIPRIPRHRGSEVTVTWTRYNDLWCILRTDPAVPNLEEILWNSRPMDKNEKLVPSIDE